MELAQLQGQRVQQLHHLAAAPRQVALGPLAVAQGAVGDGQRRVHRAGPGLQLQGALVMARRGPRVAGAAGDVAEEEVGQGAIRIQLQRPFQLGPRAFRVSLADADLRQPHAGRQVLRPQLQGPSQSLRCRAQLAGGLVEDAQVVEPAELVRRQADGVAIGRGRRLVQLVGVQAAAQLAVGVGQGAVVGPAPRLLQLGLGGGELGAHVLLEPAQIGLRDRLERRPGRGVATAGPQGGCQDQQRQRSPHPRPLPPPAIARRRSQDSSPSP